VTVTSPSALRPAEPHEVREAIADALAGGPPVAPLPTDPVGRRAALRMLRTEEPVVEPEAAAVVATSGSTGEPKGVVLSRSAMRAAVAATHERLGGPGDWILALPSHYVAGLMVLVRGLVAGSAVGHCTGDLSDLPGAAGALVGPRYLAVVAVQLARGLADPVVRAALAGLDAVLLGGGPAPPGLVEQARASGVPVVTTYGMSETCGGCVYDGIPLEGVEVRTDAADGRIWIGGPLLFSGYRLRPDLTREALPDDHTLRTADRGRLVEGSLDVLGRVDDVVVTGGLNVDLAEVERAAQPWARDHRAEIVVVAIPDTLWGTAIVAVSDLAADLPGLRSYLADRLSPPALPRRLVARGTLPRTAGGKIDRQLLRAELRSDRAAGTPLEPGLIRGASR
jgi:O-succinylbenzoic acid--CoA ligase